MSKVLITGAAGFIGSQLMYAFRKAGEEVVGIDNFSFGYKDNLIFDDLDLQDEVVELDIRDYPAMRALFEREQPEYVYHCAAITTLPDCQANIERCMATNAAATANLLELARDFHVRKFMFASTSAVYENETEFPCKEKLDVAPSLMYSTSKMIGERLCKSFADCYGMNITVFRFANVYGPRMDCLRVSPPVVAYMIRELYYGRKPVLHSDGNQARDFVYSEDLVELAVKVRETTGFDIVNISTNNAWSINQLYAAVAHAMDKDDVKPDYAPTKHFWEQYPELFEPVPIRDQIIEHEITKYTLCDNSYAQERYGWHPHTTLEQGVAACVDFTIAKLEKVA